MLGISSLTVIAILWGVVAAILAALLIYRSLISMKEDDQLFLDASEATLEAEQRHIVGKLARLAPYTKGFGIASAALTFALAGLWLYQAVNRPSLP